MRRICRSDAARVPALLLLAATATACAAGGADGMAPPGGDAGGARDAGYDGGTMCSSDRDCGPGLVCAGGVCVVPSDGGQADAGPPEDEQLEFQPPVGSEHYVFVVNTTLGTVAKIAPGSLAHIEVSSIEVGLRPTVLEVVPGTDDAVVLNEGSRSVSVIRAGAERDEVIEVPVGQPYTSMRMSPDGRAVIVYFDQSGMWTDPSSSASKVALVDVAAVIEGETSAVYEFAVGYRVTDVFFDRRAGPHGPVSSRALIVSKSEIAVADLERMADTRILPRVWLDNPQAELVEQREVLATPDGVFVLVRNLHAAELTVVDVEAATSTRLLLPGVPTDVDLSPDGAVALVVMRAAGMVARVDLPADLERVVEVDGVRYFDPDGDGVAEADELAHAVLLAPGGAPRVAGQAELFTGPDGRLAALLYTNAYRREEIGVLDVESLDLEVLDRLINKLVDRVVVGPGGDTALVLHRPEPDSDDPDPVERAIDALYGYTLVDLPSGATFQQVAEAGVGPMAFSSTGRHALLAVCDPATGVNQLHVIDLLRLTLQMDFVPLEALPRFAGVLPGGEIGYVAQEHPYGKITFIDMQTMSKRAVTGYELNAD